MSKGAFLPSPYPGGFQLPPLAYGGRNLFVPPRRMPLPMSLFSPLQTQQPMPMQPPMQIVTGKHAPLLILSCN